MVGMLVGYEYGAYLIDSQPHLLHPYLRLSARQTRIYQHGIGTVTYIITVAVATRIK